MSSTADKICAELRSLAEDLDRRALAAGDAIGVYVEAEPAACQATVLLIRAACAGLFGDLARLMGRAYAATGTEPVSAADQFAGTLAYFGRSAELGARPTPDERWANWTLSAEAVARLNHIPQELLIPWGLLVRPHLQNTRPGDFRPDDGQYDFPRATTESHRVLEEGQESGSIDWSQFHASRVAHARLGPLGSYQSEKALTHARAHARVWAETIRAAANRIEELGATPPPPTAFEAAENYSWVKWPSGRTFTFTPAMRPVVKKLCEDYRRGRAGTAKDDLLDASTRTRATAVRDLFKCKGGTPAQAWGTMIVRVERSRDVYTIRDPGPTHEPKTNQQRRRSRTSAGCSRSQPCGTGETDPTARSRPWRCSPSRQTNW